MILAGDVGGTKVHLALFDFTDGNLKHTRDKQFPAKEYSGLEEIVKEFVLTDKVTSACFGVPGPVRDGRLRLTNLPWTLDSRELARDLKIDYVFLINDLQANGYGIAELGRGPDLHAERGRCPAGGQSRADLGGNGPGRGVSGLGWTQLCSLPIGGRPLGLCAAQRRRDRPAALSEAEVQRAHQL